MSKSAIEGKFVAVEDLGKDLATISAQDLQQAAADAVNRVSDESYVLFKSAMTQGLTLTQAYVTNKMRTERATPGNRVSAKIIATRSESRPNSTLLGHYSARPILKPVANPKRSKGNTALGIPAGMKQDGFTVSVRQGSQRAFSNPDGKPKAVMWPTKRDSEGNPLLFYMTGGRTKTGKPQMKALYGPSVYQLFRYQINELSDTIAESLDEALAEEAERIFERTYK